MPGYGYAEAPKDKVALWGRLVRDYLRGRATLARVLLLIDARHGLKGNDAEIMALLDEAAVTFQVVLTKADKIKPHIVPKIVAATEQALAKHPAAYPQVLATSSETGEGLPLLRVTIAQLVAERA